MIYRIRWSGTGNDDADVINIDTANPLGATAHESRL